MPGFKNIAVASTFSPRFLPLLAEAKRFADACKVELKVIHAGAKTIEHEQKFTEGFAQLGISSDTSILWLEGETPARAISDGIEANGIDLVIAGALEHESHSRHYVGDVARGLMRRANCSLLFFTAPDLAAKEFTRIATVTDFSPLSKRALQMAMRVGEMDSAAMIHVVRILTVFSQALAASGSGETPGAPRSSQLENETLHLEQFIEEAGECPIPIDTKCTEGTTGFAASDYVQAIEADLLVLGAQNPGAGQLFPAGTDWILQVIPTNLLVVRE
jgi:nucleotide-binding universal stress UspA family protein